MRINQNLTNHIFQPWQFLNFIPYGYDTVNLNLTYRRNCDILSDIFA